MTGYVVNPGNYDRQILLCVAWGCYVSLFEKGKFKNHVVWPTGDDGTKLTATFVLNQDSHILLVNELYGGVRLTGRCFDLK